MQVEDFQNWTLEKCKDVVIEYQQTKKAEIFHNLLARFDRYILHTIYEMRKKTPYLWGEELQELYHTGILGLHKGILAFKNHLPPFFLVLVIKAYIKAELKQAYSYKMRESRVESFIVQEQEEETISKELDVYALFNLLENSMEFSAKDKKVILMRYKDGLTVEEIATKLSLPEVNIYKNIQRVVKRLKIKLDSELKNFS